MYYWTEPSALRHLSACHAVELSYVFGNLQETIYTGVPADPDFSRQVQDLWAQFARSGKPGERSCRDEEESETTTRSGRALFWPRYTPKTRAAMALCKEGSHTEYDILPQSRRLLFPILHAYINPSYTALSLGVPFVYRTGAALITLLGGAFALAWRLLRRR